MTLIRITAPASYPVTVDEAKANGRIEYTAEDTLITGYIAAATAYAERYTGRVFVSQTWELVMDEFPDSEITVDLGPIVSVTSIKYLDGDGVEQTIDAADYTVDTASASGRIAPVDSWPAAKEVLNAVRVRFVVGAGVPDEIKQAIILMVEHFNEYRDGTGVLSPAVFALLDLERRMFV
jgi:uncharacterized phiE125 gp8 family phage protein